MKVLIVAYKGVGFGSKLISWATRGFSHVSLRFVGVPAPLKIEMRRTHNVIISQDHEIESIQRKGVHAFPFEKRGEQHFFEFNCDERQAEEVLRRACELVGSKYDWRGIGGFLLRGAKWQNQKKWFCSELVAHCLKSGGITLMNMPDHWIQPNICVRTPVCREVEG